MCNSSAKVPRVIYKYDLLHVWFWSCFPQQQNFPSSSKFVIRSSVYISSGHLSKRLHDTVTSRWDPDGWITTSLINPISFMPKCLMGLLALLCQTNLFEWWSALSGGFVKRNMCELTWGYIRLVYYCRCCLLWVAGSTVDIGFEVRCLNYTWHILSYYYIQRGHAAFMPNIETL